ncbi:MAG: amidohydrolase family protein [Steroidobacteraceae bacterium]
MALEVTGKYRYPPPNPRWLALHQETALEPELPIVDAHHHLWDEPGNRYQSQDLTADIADSGHRIVATVYVQAHAAYRTHGPEHLRCVGETEAAERVRQASVANHDKTRMCAAIVGYADLRDGTRLDEVLEAHQEASPAFRGVRQSAARDRHFPEGIVLRPAPEGMLADEAMRAGVRRLGRSGLRFDAMVYHEQLAELASLARAVPNTCIMLNHYGCPLGVGPYAGHEAERYAVWRDGIAELARCENVHVKLGGLGMIVTGARYHLQDKPPDSSRLAADWKPWIEACIESFGTHRCLFEGNFPVDKAMFSYGVLWNACKLVTAALSREERLDLFGRNAMSFYGLSPACV